MGCLDSDFSWTADAKGSTKAGKEFAKSCGIAPQKIATDTPNWQTRVVQQDASTGAQQAVLIGSLERGGQLYASCDTNGAPHCWDFWPQIFLTRSVMSD